MSELKDKEEQYSIFLKHEDEEIKKTNIFATVFRALLSIFVTVILIIFALSVLNNYYDISTLLQKWTGGKTEFLYPRKPDLTPSKFNLNMLSRYQNILILGVDSNGPNTLPYSGVRSDTIIIASIDLKGKSVNAISVPRDSKVYLADEHGVQKINSAYAFGGIELTKKTVEETFGIKIHNYIIINAEGIRQIIDAIGGVPVHIDQNMKYNDFAGKLHINFQKGDYILDGKQTEEFLRFRKDSLGDIGRVHRQQKFIKALIEKIKAPDTVRKIPEAIKIAGLYSRTDLNLYQMSQYASIAREIDMNKVEFVMLPGAPNKRGMVSYWILDPEKTQQVINRLIYRQKDDSPESLINIGVMYSQGKEQEAAVIKDALKAEGYNVNCTGHSSQIRQSEIIGYNSRISLDKIRTLKKKISQTEDLTYIHNPVRNFCESSDIVITLYNDEE